MGRTAKNILKYRGAELPENLSGILGNADENDLKILIALMMAANADGELPDDATVSEALEIDKADVTAAVKFWRGAGIIVSASVQKKKNPEKPLENAQTRESKPTEENTEKAEKQESAHRGGALESADSSSYMTSELADIFEKRAVPAEFIDEAQRVFGKTFNSYDTSLVVGLIDRLGFEEEAVLAILAYVVRIGKRGVRYAEKIAIALYDDGYTRAREVVDRIAVIERAAEEAVKIKKLFGIGDRELSRSEKTLFEKWTKQFGYDLEIIRIAYDITIDAIQKPVPKYAGSIIEKWYNEGLRTLADVEAYEKNKREAKSGSAEGEKSYDIDDFFEAALQRSFEDHKNT